MSYIGFVALYFVTCSQSCHSVIANEYFECVTQSTVWYTTALKL